MVNNANQELGDSSHLVLYEFYKRNPVEWMKDCVKTFDEHDKLNAIKAFPIYPYVPVVSAALLAEEIIHIPKSRQMMLSWLIMALILHEAQFHGYQLQAVFSKKEEDANVLVERCKFMYENQPAWLKNLCPLERKMRDMQLGHLYFANGSKLRGFAQGKDQIRSYVPSTAVLDEAAFQEKFQETYEALVPCAAKIVSISSANASFFQLLCDPAGFVPPGDILGVKDYRNDNKHRVIQIHYSADPDKNPATEQGKVWVEKKSQKYIGGMTSLGWRREMEIDWKAGSGELIFPEFTKRENELIIDPFEIPDTYNLYGGFDWGNRNPVSFHVYAESPDQEFFSIWEHYIPGVNTNVFEVARVLAEECPFIHRLQWIACDPAMWKEDQQRVDGKTSIARMFVEDVPDKHKIFILRPADGRSDMGAIQKFKILFFQFEKPKFRIFKTCPRQSDEFRNLKYAERVEFKNESEKILDKDNHAWDDGKYFLLSHPWAQVLTPRLKPGTVGYQRMVADAAQRVAAETGQDFNFVFNDLNGAI